MHATDRWIGAWFNFCDKDPEQKKEICENFNEYNLVLSYKGYYAVWTVLWPNHQSVPAVPSQ